ncbi:hypothetical protein V5P93_003557 [Actinokineospora auranticolor]|uniref:NACHT domain-containing protein n=1 Tax=Actinokineospora auranticolor TaxID=155976 RepID=A0A2S6GPX7_9PSEU|nr:hypothetical protein [Actinokineospora auranticolor]PPK67220.1 hypothetical protein CLV40_108218 [Actinokineospora auranticolor]
MVDAPGSHNEISGGHFTGPVVQAARIDQVVFGSAEAAEHPPLTEWAALPRVTPGLVDLLEAQREAVDTLPYRLLGVRRPELAKVYVQQRIRAREDRTPESGEPRRPSSPFNDGGDRPLSAGEALDRGGHMVITGEPGAGKSTLGHMYVQQICDCWLGVEGAQPPLREPVLPLRVPARALADDRAWSELLAAGTRDAVGPLLTSAPEPALFAKRAFGARWLVFIDGLDEIADRSTRERVIRAITARMRRSELYRIVVTTRPLPTAEMKPFEEVGADTFVIQPFGPMELEEFATAWFRAQNALTGRTRAAEFVRQVSDGKLRELVRNPLLATIAAIAHTLEPDRDLPRSTASLYQRFMDYLLTDETSGRRTRDELRRALSHLPARLELATWIDDHRVDLIEALAVVRLDTDKPLFDAARDWVLAKTSITEPPPGWEEDMRALLTSSGVFTRTEDALRFSHQSFAEFLAARSHARDIDPDFTAVDDWIERGVLPATQDYALFTFVLWGSQGNDITAVLRKLLGMDTDHVLLAGRLLTGDLPVGRALTTEIIGRLIDLLLLAGLFPEPFGPAREVRAVLTSIGVHQDVVLDRLRRTRDNTDLPLHVRVEAAIGVGLIDDRADALAWLGRQASVSDPDVLQHITSGFADLEADSGTRVERLLTGLARGAGANYVLSLAYVSGLLDSHRTAAAAELAQDTIAAMRADPQTTADPLVPPAHGNRSPQRLRDSWVIGIISDGRYNWAGIAELLGRAGLRGDAAWAARLALATDCDITAFTEAVTALLSAEGASAVAEVVAAASTKSVAYLLGCAEAVQEFDRHTAGELARSCLTMHGLRLDGVRRAVQLALEAKHSPDDLVAEVANAPHPAMGHRTYFAATLAILDHQSQACSYARSLLATSVLLPSNYWSVIRTLLVHSDEPELALVLADAAARPVAYIAQLAPVLSEAGRESEAAALLRQVVDTAPPAEVLLEIHDDLDEDGPRELRALLLDTVLGQVGCCSCADLRRLAEALHRDGRRAEAHDILRRAVVLAMNTEDDELATIAGTWLDQRGIHESTELVQAVLDRDLPARLRLRVATRLSTFGALSQAVCVWTDVVVHHGGEVALGILAADRMIQTGHRAGVDAALAQALGRDDLPHSTRARLTALRAWVDSSAPSSDR